jgi:hypothetical protein
MATQEHKQVAGPQTRSLFPDVNGRIEDFSPEHVVDCELLCECAAKGCLGRISLTLDEYETVRRVSAHSFVLPGHEVREIDRVVEQSDRYMVVRRSPTTPLLPAVRLDS